jgi:hypothetical protein
VIIIGIVVFAATGGFKPMAEQMEKDKRNQEMRDYYISYGCKSFLDTPELKPFKVSDQTYYCPPNTPEWKAGAEPKQK